MQWLSVNQAVKNLPTGPVVKEVSFALEPRQRLGIAGETGAGKSSLLKMIAGLLQPDQGEIFFEQRRVLGPEEKLLPGHPAIAYLSQHFELINHYRVEEFLALSNVLEKEEAARLYVRCGIDHLLKKKTTQLSGGERQRVALANAVGKRPRLLLLDEPFSNLDFANKENIKELLVSLELTYSVTSLIVSHDASDLLSWADTILLMQKGQIVQQGLAQTLYLKPLNAYCAGLLGAYTQVPFSWLAALTGQDNVYNKEGLVFVRPEQLCIALQQQDAHAQVATLESVSYMGSHMLALVRCNKIQVKVNTRLSGLQPGQTVYLSTREWVW